MTEIPEHLLRRSKERREGGGASGEAPAAAGTESTGVVAAAAAPPARVEPPAAPSPPPEPAYVAAARRRARIPFWALPVLVALPVWAFIYMEAMSPVHQAPQGPLAVGATVFNTCASCHGAGGEGLSGYKLNQGEVLKTFPKIEDQILFVANGSPVGSDPYGDKNRAGGQRVSGALGGGKMPAWKTTFSIAQIVGAVCHERYVIAGADQNDAQWQKDFNNWCVEGAPQYVAAQADGAKVLADLATAASS